MLSQKPVTSPFYDKLLTYKIEQYVPTHKVLVRANVISHKNNNKHYVLSKRGFNLRLLSKFIKSQKIGTLDCKILSMKEITLNIMFFLSYKKIKCLNLRILAIMSLFSKISFLSILPFCFILKNSPIFLPIYSFYSSERNCSSSIASLSLQRL